MGDPYLRSEASSCGLFRPTYSLHCSSFLLGFGVPYFNTFFLKEPLRNRSLYFFSPWLLKSPVCANYLVGFLNPKH